MKHPSHRNKSEKSKPAKKVKEVILVVYEGRSTEFNYIGGIKREHRHSNVHLKGPHPDPKTLVLETKKLLGKKQDFDKVYCVFDHDGRKSFEEALKLIAAHNKNHPIKIEAITSNPCFEIWPLLHYKYTTKCYQTATQGTSSSKALIKEIQKYFPGYRKNSPTIYLELQKNTPHAIKNAKKLSLYQGHDCTKNPFTDLHKLVQMLFDLSEN